MKVSSFLGFTGSLKEPRKTRAEDTLSKAYRYNGNIYSAVEYLCIKVLEGYTPEKHENYCYYKRDGSLTKARTLYKLNEPGGKFFIELSKTEYDFVVYLVNRGLTSPEAIEACDKAEIAKKRAADELAAATAAAATAVAKEQQAHEAEMSALIKKEAAEISESERSIVDSVFLSLYGNSGSLNYTLVPLIHHFDDEYCRNEIIRRLHNDNRASIKIFECLTGLKLPKAYKARKSYLEEISSSDFKGPVLFSPALKNKVEVEQETFYKLMTKNKELSWCAVLGEPVEKYGFSLFWHREGGEWRLSLQEIGMHVASGSSKAVCLSNFKTLIDNKGVESFRAQIADCTEAIYGKIGVNPRFEEQQDFKDGLGFNFDLVGFDFGKEFCWNK